MSVVMSDVKEDCAYWDYEECVLCHARTTTRDSYLYHAESEHHIHQLSLYRNNQAHELQGWRALALQRRSNANKKAEREAFMKFLVDAYEKQK